MPRFLHPHATAGSRDYVSKPLREVNDDPPEVRERIAAACSLRDEPEAPSGAWVNASSELAAKYDFMRRLKAHEEAKVDRAKLTPQHRLLDVQRRARERRQNFDHEIHVICKMLNRGNQGGVRRLERLEALLDGVLEVAA